MYAIKNKILKHSTAGYREDMSIYLFCNCSVLPHMLLLPNWILSLKQIEDKCFEFFFHGSKDHVKPNSRIKVWIRKC